MTIKQGQDINQKFTDLTGHITKLKDSLISQKEQINNLNLEKNKFNITLTKVTLKSEELESENVKLKKSLENEQNMFLSERKKWAGWMFFSFVVTVMLGVFK